MANKELAHIIYLMSVYLEMEGAPFRVAAYRNAAFSIEAMNEDIYNRYLKGGKKEIEKIPGIGASISRMIEEYLLTGKINYFEELKKAVPVDLDNMLLVEGIGPKTIKDLYLYRNIKNLEELEVAAKKGKLRDIPNFGIKTEANIIEAINFLKRDRGRSLVGIILPQVELMCQEIKNSRIVDDITYAGSLRRMKETIGDIDLLAISNKPERVMDYFVSQKGVKKIWGKGKSKASIRTAEGFDVDLRVVPEKSYGSALLYFTGSKEHNIALRRIAIQNKLKLNEYGLFKGRTMLKSETEEDIYCALKMAWISPEMRENTGEIEAALNDNLPKLITIGNIKGDLHCHSNWNGGANSIKEIAEAGIKRGYQYLGISDHTKFLKIENGLDEKQLIAQNKEIKQLNSDYHQKGISFTILHGCEANILADGRLDINDSVLQQLDYVIAGVHSQLKMAENQMTARIIRAMNNPNVDIISHPTGRLLKKREEFQIDIDKVMEAAKKTKTILEINSSSERLDLNEKNIRRAKEWGVKMVINTDSHNKENLSNMRYGVGQARRGWATREDIINTQLVSKLTGCFKRP